MTGGALRTRLAGLGRIRLAVTLAALLAVAMPATLLGWAWRAAGRLDLVPAQDAPVILAAGRRLDPGLSVTAIDLAGTLRRLRYREVTRAPSEPGQFRRREGAWEIFLRPRDDPAAPRPALRARLMLAGDRILAIHGASDEARLSEIELEPEVLTDLQAPAGQLRQPVRLDAVPRHLVAAILAVEDRRFFEHWGVDPWAVGRAVWVNVRHGEVLQGGSTLTQQLVKNLAVGTRRTWSRKLREAMLAFALERRRSKHEIFEAYLNAIYLGQHGAVTIYGVGAAARSYFGKSVEDLSLSEAALLAGMIRAPNTYSPVHHPERARERRRAVLQQMRDLDVIEPAAFTRADREPLRVQRAASTPLLAPYFVDYVRAQAEQLGAEPARGLRVYTTLDPALQRAAEGAVARGLDRLETRFRPLRRAGTGARLQGALVAMDVASGEIRAMVGGRDYGQSQFNRVAHAHRQPGSAFKPFVYLAALGAGSRGEPPKATPVTLVDDEPLVVRHAHETWSPRNYQDRFEGRVTVRRALEQSLNAATVRIALDTGLDAVIRTAREVGFTSPMEAVPALALGSFEVTPLELAGAYASLTRPGGRATPTAVRAVVDRDGVVLAPRASPGDSGRVAPERYLVTHLLRGVVDRGTAAPARDWGLEGEVAAKTGTTNDGRDAWVVGYTPRLVALVWVGFDARDVMGLSGAQAALPIWTDFMRAATAVLPGGSFAVSPAITFRDIDAANGRLAGPFCPVVLREAFLESTEPHEPCTEHGPGNVLEVLVRRLFGIAR